MNEYFILTIIFLIYFSPVFYQLVKVIRESKKGNKSPLKKLKKTLRISLLVIFPSTLVFGILCHTNFLDYEKPLTFDKYEQITFENFRGLEFFKKALYGNERFAYIMTSIDYSIQDNSVTIESLFYPSKSFVYKKNNDSEELLSHEKYHFKITELFARKAKCKISKLTYFEKERIRNIIEEMKIKERKFQKKYDYDTFHSYVYGEQKKYEKRIDSLLNLLSIYKKPKIEFNDKN